MNEFIAQLVSGGLGGGITGGIAYLLISNYLSNRDKEREELARNVETLTETINTLKNERVRKLEDKIEDHIKDDKSQKILTIVEHMSTRQGKIDDAVSMLDKKVSSLDAKDEERYRYIKNLDESFQRHKQQEKA